MMYYKYVIPAANSPQSQRVNFHQKARRFAVPGTSVHSLWRRNPQVKRSVSPPLRRVGKCTRTEKCGAVVITTTPHFLFLIYPLEAVNHVMSMHTIGTVQNSCYEVLPGLQGSSCE